MATWWPYYDYDDYDYDYDDYDDSNRSDMYGDSDGYDSDYSWYVKRENKKTYDEDDTCRFEYNSYYRELLAELNSQRHTKDFLDLVIKVQGRRFRCHRAVLASTPFFKAMLSSNLAERRSKVVKLQGIDPNSFSKIMDFLYTGEIRISKDDVQDILQAAHMLQIDKITEYCRDFIKDHLCLSNCLGVMRLADVYEFSDLIEDARDMALSNFSELGQNDEFLTLSEEELLDLLKDEELHITDEDDVVAAVMRWLDHDLPNRKIAMVAMFQEIRLMSVRVNTLKKLELHPVIQDSPECLAKITAAKEKHLADATLPQVSAGAELDDCDLSPRLGTSDDLTIFVGGWRTDFGIMFDDYAALTKPLQSVICFDPDSEQCYHISNLPTAVTGYMSVTNAKKHLYVTGGRAHPLIGEQGPHSAPSRQAFRYDFATDTWTQLPHMPHGRAGHQSAIVDGKLFLVGGDTDDTSTFSMDCYDLEEEAWIEPPTLPEMTSLDFTVTSCDGKILLVELYNNTEEVRNWEDRTKLRVHSFDVKAAHWLYTDISVLYMYSLHSVCKLVTVVHGNVHILLNSNRSYSPQMFLYHVEQASLSKLEDIEDLSVSFWGTQYVYQEQHTIHREDLADSIICYKFDEDDIRSSRESDITRTWNLTIALFGHSFLATKKSCIGWYCRDLDKLWPERDEED